MSADQPKQPREHEHPNYFDFTSEVPGGPRAITHNHRECFPEIIGTSASLQALLKDVSKIAKSDSSTLIYGESGTGKELIAAALHRLSMRCDKKFIAINCSAIPEDLLESELFGYEKGAFTGAHHRKAGYFEAADGGTIFLDEIGDMPLRLQAKLLRVLQEKKYSLVGSTQLKNTDVRVIAATNVHLEKAIQEKTFRTDLYYRLNVIPLKIPSLRERREDIPLLLEHFLTISNKNNSFKQQCYLSETVITFLMDYPFPGNVRELQNLVERIVVIKGGGVIGVEDLPVSVQRNRRQGAAAGSGALGAQQRHDEQLGALNNELPFAQAAGAEFSAMTQQTLTPDALSPSVSRAGGTTMDGDDGLQVVRLMPDQVAVQVPEDGFDLCQFVERVENDCILEALRRTGNNKNRAAKLLGLNRTTLVERIKKRKLAPLNPPSKEI